MRLVRPLTATAAVLVFMLISVRPAMAQALTPAETAQVDKLVIDTLASTGTPSASIAIVRGGQIVYTNAYGKQ